MRGHALGGVHEQVVEAQLLDVDVALTVQRRRQQDLPHAFYASRLAASPTQHAQRAGVAGGPVEGRADAVHVLRLLEDGDGRFFQLAIELR